MLPQQLPVICFDEPGPRYPLSAASLSLLQLSCICSGQAEWCGSMPQGPPKGMCACTAQRLAHLLPHRAVDEPSALATIPRSPQVDAVKRGSLEPAGRGTGSYQTPVSHRGWQGSRRTVSTASHQDMGATGGAALISFCSSSQPTHCTVNNHIGCIRFVQI